jgi:hypothetical protein
MMVRAGRKLGVWMLDFANLDDRCARVDSMGDARCRLVCKMGQLGGVYVATT